MAGLYRTRIFRKGEVWWVDRGWAYGRDRYVGCRSRRVARQVADEAELLQGWERGAEGWGQLARKAVKGLMR